MKPSHALKVSLAICLGLTLFFCHVSHRLHDMSTYSLAFGSGPEPPSLGQLFRYAAYLDIPSSFSGCINNLRQMDGAKQQWALEHGITWTTNGTPDGITWSTNPTITWKDIEPYIKHGARSDQLWCPHGGRYSIGKLSDPPTCSIKNHKLP